jgi:hypothetical protein
VFGQHWGVWDYDRLLIPPDAGGYDWTSIMEKIGHIASYANTLAVHSSMELEPWTGEIRELKNNCRREEALRALYTRIREDHPDLQLMDKLHLTPTTKKARNHIKPTRKIAKKFFEHYSEAIQRQAEIAYEHNIEFLSVACELDGFIKYTQEWIELIEAVRKTYAGTIIYSGIPINMQTYQTNNKLTRRYILVEPEDSISLAMFVDKIGIDFYMPLGSRNSHDAQTMMEDMKPFKQTLTDINEETGKRIIITETGHNGIKGKHLKPWNWDRDAVDDPIEQKNYLTAVFATTYKHPAVDGVLLYNSTCSYDIQGKPAEYAILEAKMMIDKGINLKI